MNTFIRNNIDFAISKFEASEFMAITELETLLNVIKFTHKLLSEYMSLDPWETIMSEVNESTSLVSFHGRIVLHAIFEIIYDITPNFVYNSTTERFLRGPVTFGEPVPRESMPKSSFQMLYGNRQLSNAYAAIGALNQHFLGLPHIQTFIRIIGKSSLNLVLNECLQNMELKLKNVLEPYVRELSSGMPPKTSLPFHDYGTEGCYGYFALKLKDVMSYPDLIPEVFQHFREWGNTIVLLKLFDFGLASIESSSLRQAAPLIGHTPSTLLKSKKESSSHSTPIYKCIKSISSILKKKKGIAKAFEVMQTALDIVERTESLFRLDGINYSVFRSSLHRIQSMLKPYHSIWAHIPTKDNVIPIDSSVEFYRFWSGVQFCYLTRVPDTKRYGKETLEMFGDGLMWAGATIIHFLGQRLRFEALDFSYHIYRVEEASTTSFNKTMAGQEMNEQQTEILSFLPNLERVRDLNGMIFCVLDGYLPVTLANNEELLHPPEEDSSEFLYTTAAGYIPPTVKMPTSIDRERTFSGASSIDSPPSSREGDDLRSSNDNDNMSHTSNEHLPPPPDVVPPPPPEHLPPPPPPEHIPPPPQIIEPTPDVSVTPRSEIEQTPSNPTTPRVKTPAKKGFAKNPAPGPPKDIAPGPPKGVAPGPPKGVAPGPPKGVAPGPPKKTALKLAAPKNQISVPPKSFRKSGKRIPPPPSAEPPAPPV
eukprot:TRINITY_DN3768_c0_g1_i1.p1 TRINITY_DN3768_c0_g1~~TRINITY_DN3768_c0_g1_i1.p1  ORF type:complete len:705 (+),score=150.10 TRINITY_DN3768_c0_g1_i1:121-2235(+)